LLARLLERFGDVRVLHEPVLDADVGTCRVRGLDRQALLRDVRDLRRGGRRAGRLCHRTLTALQNCYSKA
jgi:hypothetical protein